MIKAPYNFVPLSDKVYYPEWSHLVSQDLPFEDGEDGIIELQMTNVTALFTRNGQGHDGCENYSANVIDENRRRRYYIPGTSLKGCFRSIMEIMSYAKMGLYNDDSFAMPRAFDTKDSTNAPYINATKHVKCGWLRQIDEDLFEIAPCKKGVQEITHSLLKVKFPRFYKGADHETAQSKQESLNIGGDLYPIIKAREGEISYKSNGQLKYVPEGSYRVVCTGYMNGKNHEYLFSTEESAPLPVSKELFHIFESVHSKTEYYSGHGSDKGFLRSRLQRGDRIPVFYTSDDKGVVAIGITKKLRIPYAYKVSDGIANCRMTKVDMSKPDLPETIFGFTRKDQSLKGRVSFSPVFCTEEIADEDLLTVRGVQGQPSASFYPLYLRHDGHKYAIYSDRGVQIAGRKRYRISANNHVMPLPQGNGNENVLGCFYALPAGHVFKGKVILHNLRKAEIGALIASITLNNTPDTFINIGLAKSFGYGKLSVAVKLNGLRHNVDEYLRAYELEMMQHGFNLSTDANLKTFVAIASEHDDADMEMMDMEGYKNAKNNKIFSKLVERSATLKTLVSYEEYQTYLEEGRKKQEMADRGQRMADDYSGFLLRGDSLKKLGQLNDAKAQYMRAKELATQLNISLELVQQKLTECDAMIEEKGKIGLASALEGKSSLGNLAGTTKKWCTFAGNNFTDVELTTLIDAIEAMPDKEKKGLKGKRKDFVKAIGEDWTQKLFEHFGI